MKHGWSFVAALTRTIECWSASAVATDAAAFLYRDCDLRFAIERSLFFRLVNDLQLQQIFDACQDGKLSEILPSDPWSAFMAPMLCGSDQGFYRHAPPYRMKQRARSLVSNLMLTRRRRHTQERLDKRAKYLFLAIHPKFVNFFMPIVDSLGPEAAFLSIQDRIVESFLAEKGLPGIGVRDSRPHRLPLTGLLGHFRELCLGVDCLADMIEDLKPKVIVVPEGNAPIYEVALVAGARRGVKTVCLQHGAPSYTNPGLRNWHFDDVLVWGKGFVDCFARYNPSQRFTVTGTPASLPRARSAAADAPIGSIGFFLQKGATLIPNEEWDELLRFIAWTAQTWPAMTVVVRDHPTQPHMTGPERAALDAFPNVRFMPPPAHSLSDVLSSVDVVVAAASTTLLEALPAGAIPFIFGTCYPKDFPDIAARHAAIRAEDLRSAKRSFSELVEDATRRMRLREEGARLASELFTATGTEGARAIAEALRKSA